MAGEIEVVRFSVERFPEDIKAKYKFNSQATPLYLAVSRGEPKL
jgi:hypothetical protein